MAVVASAMTTTAKTTISLITSDLERFCCSTYASFDSRCEAYVSSKSSGTDCTRLYPSVERCSDSTRSTDHMPRRHTSAAAVKGEMMWKNAGICFSIRSDGISVVVQINLRKKVQKDRHDIRRRPPVHALRTEAYPRPTQPTPQPLELGASSAGLKLCVRNDFEKLPIHQDVPAEGKKSRTHESADVCDAVGRPGAPVSHGGVEVAEDNHRHRSCVF
mmetsp:Transcript_33848/g.79665  ORF Transcript_33848/g.79665 Transcript_33848/m.79665 type:complete len:217 (-) Transcript_33848:1560-2210(-)